MIPLMKNAFLKEHETKLALADFIIKSDRLSMMKNALNLKENLQKSRAENMVFCLTVEAVQILQCFSLLKI
jgi:hypothetical protein